MSGRQPTLCPIWGENPTGWWAGGKGGGRAFLSSVKYLAPFKVSKQDPTLMFFQLLCLFCIISAHLSHSIGCKEDSPSILPSM